MASEMVPARLQLTMSRAHSEGDAERSGGRGGRSGVRGTRSTREPPPPAIRDMPPPLTRPLLLRHQQPFLLLPLFTPSSPIGNSTEVAPVSLVLFLLQCFFLACIAFLLPSRDLRTTLLFPSILSLAVAPFRVTVSWSSSRTNKLYLAWPSSVLPPSPGWIPAGAGARPISAIGDRPGSCDDALYGGRT